MTESRRRDAIVGCLLGGAVGDAIGLPGEGLHPRRLERSYPNLDGHRFLFGRGMVSDDTEHALITAQALLFAGDNPETFARSLVRGLRKWFLGMPAGIGLATLKSCLRLLVGFGPDRSGVFSAGNGPCMRASILGVCFADDQSLLPELTRVSTRITHTDPKAEWGAIAVATAAACASLHGPCVHSGQVEMVLATQPGAADELRDLIGSAWDSVQRDESTEEFALVHGMGRGVSGYVNQTVPVALHAWMRHPNDLRNGVLAVVRCGGDTDTVAAIAGGIIGAGVGRAGIPQDWLDGLMEWPHTVRWMESLANQLSDSLANQPQPGFHDAPFAAIALRNLLFTTVVLAHGFRRLAPPY